MLLLLCFGLTSATSHADTFVNARNISYWSFYRQEILLLSANTFYLQDRNNSIYMESNKLHTIEAGTFVMPATTGTVECILLGYNQSWSEMEPLACI